RKLLYLYLASQMNHLSMLLLTILMTIRISLKGFSLMKRRVLHQLPHYFANTVRDLAISLRSVIDFMVFQQTLSLLRTKDLHPVFRVMFLFQNLLISPPNLTILLLASPSLIMLMNWVVVLNFNNSFLKMAFSTGLSFLIPLNRM
ncbi:hypothetical protein HAX54_019476, partial [Datura stramonium]|nr:hypothetical protein [Datura stramonium]